MERRITRPTGRSSRRAAKARQRRNPSDGGPVKSEVLSTARRVKRAAGPTASAQADGPAPVLHHGGGALEAEVLHHGGHGRRVAIVGVEGRVHGLVGAAEPGVVGGDHPVAGGEQHGGHLAVEEAPGGLAVEQHDGRPGALVEVVEAQALPVQVVGGEREPGQAGEALVRGAAGLRAHSTISSTGRGEVGITSTGRRVSRSTRAETLSHSAKRCLVAPSTTTSARMSSAAARMVSAGSSPSR